MSSGGQVIRATQMFLKHGAGASKGVNLKAELLYGATLGVGVGLTWKVSQFISRSIIWAFASAGADRLDTTNPFAVDC